MNHYTIYRDTPLQIILVDLPWSAAVGLAPGLVPGGSVLGPAARPGPRPGLGTAGARPRAAAGPEGK